ncbi:cell wall-binding repeat-containing protein [Gryllotalpicola protaetiae]|uniref:Cell wall-binding repeat-containing protein n=1 Tax=Gryllotalpicola protaetiae TaxID=2419771 RepID=A0A387BJK9_9MICO|nr:cell wall-binding repeat-containing protein [Gryllotalpicola protaetiae]AYG04285.1 cell wall-binding repeat-containing protein [Gryllotalpicola protaetiae]
MIRSTGLAAALTAVAVAIALVAPTRAAADETAGADLVGAFDSAAFVAGEGVVLSGWAIDLNAPQAANSFIDLTWSDGSQTRDHSTEYYHVSDPRPDVAAAYPAAGPDHGFSWVWGLPGPGTYTFCLSVGSLVTSYFGPDHDKYFEKPLGCRSLTVPDEVFTGAIDQFGPNPAGPGFVLTGWAASNYGLLGMITDSTGTHEGPYIGDATLTIIPDDGSAPITEPDFGFNTTTVRADAPQQPARNFSVTLPGDATRNIAGTYQVCVSMSNSAGPPDVHLQIACASTHLLAFKASTVVPATPILLGQTVAPASVAVFPTEVSTGMQWTVDGMPVSATSSLPISDSYVGHQVDGWEWVAAPGYVSASFEVAGGTASIPGVTTVRAAGADRYATSVAISQQEFPDSAAGTQMVYLASGAGFADAISAGPAAAAANAPLLLTAPDAIPPTVLDELRRLHPAQIVIVGGTASISTDAAAQAAGVAPVTRIAGADRYATSIAVADFAFPDGAGSAFVVSGAAFPDALSAGAAAATTHGPVLLTTPETSPVVAALTSALGSLGVKSATIVGGTSAVDAGVQSAIAAVIPVTRLAGADRDATSQAVATAFASATTVYLASDAGFPDGLSGSAAAGHAADPLIVTGGGCIDPAVIDRIVALGASTVVVVGGYSSLEVAIDRLLAC